MVKNKLIKTILTKEKIDNKLDIKMVSRLSLEWNTLINYLARLKSTFQKYNINPKCNYAKPAYLYQTR
jgi:hypothetical protein